MSKEDKNMTIQEAAHIILEEFGKPMSSKEISRIALDRGMVSSRPGTKDPKSSHAQTIEKNVRSGVLPKLIFIGEPRSGRLIGLPSMNGKFSMPAHPFIKSADNIELRARIPADLFEKVQLATQAKFASNLDETVSALLKKGLAAVASDIKKRLLDQIDQFDE
jgi:hypothetical protein